MKGRAHAGESSVFPHSSTRGDRASHERPVPNAPKRSSCWRSIVPQPAITIIALAARDAHARDVRMREYGARGRPCEVRASVTDAYREARLLRRSHSQARNPTDLPVEQATKFELVINLQDGQVARPRCAADAARPRRRGDRMKRRQFISLIGGAAAWPLAARAQQAERMRRIGGLAAAPPNDPEGQARMRGVRAGLRELGWTEGHNMRIDYPLGRGQCRRQSQTRGRIGRARARRHPRLCRRTCRAIAAGDAALCRSCSCRSPTRSAPASSTAWRGRAATLPDSRRSNTDQREMAGTAQRDRARRDAGGRPSGSTLRRRDRTVGCNPICGAVVRRGVSPSICATLARSSAPSAAFARPEWRL